MINKQELSEEDVKRIYITPAIDKAGWEPKKQVRQEVYFTAGKILIHGKTIKRGVAKKADYILYFKADIPLAIVEAKDNKHSVSDGMQQGLEYAEILDLPFVFSSNGDGFVFHDRSKGTEKEISLTNFPSPHELWEKYKLLRGITKEEEEKIITADYYFEPGYKEPRYYQRIAINRTVEAIAKGRKRNLLVMATGTGKTYTAFQIIYRLKKAKKVDRVLYLADRNILVDQPITNDFKPFSKVMTKVSNRNADPSYEIHMALYQGLTGEDDWKNIYKQFRKDYFDLIVVDECHRGSARIDSVWREILEYFEPAIQIGMTATPKETKKVSNIDYFGEPLYLYSLRQGIEDGFLAPYRVIKVGLDKDLQGYRPKRGEVDKYGNEIPDRYYNSRDFDRNLVIDERTATVAKKITEFLKNTDRLSKTIIFCVDIEHAERMRRALVNENADLVKKNRKYIMRITGDDNVGKKELDNFVDSATKFPTIVTTSKLLTTGIDVQTCKLIVLDAPIQSLPEFKQIIGRGTRIKEEYGKYYFTIMDFRKVTDLFADPEFDGDPVQILKVKEGDEVKPPEIDEYGASLLNEGELIYESPDITINEESAAVRKYYVKNTPVIVINEVVQYHDPSGKLITENLKDYTKKNVEKEFRSLHEFIEKWTTMERKEAIIEELEEQGVLFGALREEVPNGEDYDPFDLILHVAYGKKPLTRSERARKVKEDSYFDKYGKEARGVIDALLDKYADEGIENLEDPEVLRVPPISKFGRPLEIMKLFGGKTGYKKVVKELEERLYKINGKAKINNS